jgi:dipeptidase E
MKYLLTSAGIKNDHIAQALSEMLGKPLSESTILFIPSAANTEREDKRWLIGNLKDLERYNFQSIDILDVAAVSKDIWLKRIKEKDVICVGGGNEKYLAEVFDSIGMKDVLLNLSDSKVYVGISAGSMVTGKFLPEDVYPSIFPEEDFGSTVSQPMNIHEFSFIPHLNSDYFKHVRKQNLENLKEKFLSTVYATDDETAIKIEGSQIILVGDGESWESKK